MIKNLVWCGLGANLFLTGIVGTIYLATTIQSTQKLEQRKKAQEIVAQHNLSKSCWQVDSADKPLIGTTVFKNSDSGKIPTSCVYFPKSQLFAYVQYRDGLVVIKDLFNRFEVRAKQSQIKADKEQK